MINRAATLAMIINVIIKQIMLSFKFINYTIRSICNFIISLVFIEIISKFFIILTLNKVIIFNIKITAHHKSVARKFLKTHFFFLPFYVRFLYALNLLTLIIFHKNETKCCRSIH